MLTKVGLTNITAKVDEFRSITWYRDNSSPKYDNANSFYAYFGEKKGEYGNSILPLRLKVQYYGDDWLFHDKFIVLIDGKTYSIIPDEVKRDSGYGGYIWEWSDQALKDYLLGEEYMISLLIDIINSNEAKIKFIGDNYYDIRIITKRQKEALRNVLLSYVAKGEYIQEIDKIVK